MAGAVGGEDTFGAGGDAQLRQALVQLLAQAGQAQGWAIVEQVLRVATAYLTHCLGQLGGRAPTFAGFEQTVKHKGLAVCLVMGVGWHQSGQARPFRG